MSARTTGNTMDLRHFHDFYFLEAILAKIATITSSKPDWKFRRSVEKLESDVQEAFNSISHEIALRIYVYLWAAACGEARHTTSSYLSFSIDQLHGGMRKDVYKKSLDYFPSDKNTQTVKDVFGQSGWSSAFGGKAWLSILEGMELYGKVSDATFIDHAVDLEHNGGCVFNKEANFGLNCYAGDGYFTSELKSFCDFKFSRDILSEEFPRFSGRVRETAVSGKVYRLFERFINVMAETIDEKVDYTIVKRSMSPRLEWLSGYSVEWDYKEFTTTGKIKKPETKTASKTVSVKHSGKTIKGVIKAKVKKNNSDMSSLCYAWGMKMYEDKVFRFTKGDARYDGYRAYYIVGDSNYIWTSRWLDFDYEQKERKDTMYAKVLTDGYDSSVNWTSRFIGTVQRFHKIGNSWISNKIKNPTSGYIWKFSADWLEEVPEQQERGKLGMLLPTHSKYDGKVHVFKKYDNENGWVTDIYGGSGDNGEWVFSGHSINFNYNKPTKKAKVLICGLGKKYEDKVFNFYREGKYWVTDKIMGGGGENGNWLFSKIALEFIEPEYKPAELQIDGDGFFSEYIADWGVWYTPMEER